MREAYPTGSATPEPSAPTSHQEAHLTKIKLDGVGLYVEYTTGEADGEAAMTAKHKRLVHADLLTAFDWLVPHLALLCELVQGVRDGELFVAADQLFSGQLDPAGPPLHERPEFKGLKVTGLTYSSGGVVLIGQRRLRGGKVLNLITPYEKLDPEQLTGTEYEHLWELGTDLRRVENEAHAYLGGKTGSAPVQGEFDFTGTGLEDIAEQVDKVVQQHAARQQAGKDAAAGKDPF